jgi:hypothetical protein
MGGTPIKKELKEIKEMRELKELKEILKDAIAVKGLSTVPLLPLFP